MSEFVAHDCQDDELYLPGSVSAANFVTGDRNLYYRLIAFEKVCESLPQAPESFNRFVHKCLSSEMHARPSWSQWLPVLAKEYRIYKLSFLIELFNCSM